MDRKTFLKLTAGVAVGGTTYLAACRDEPAGGLDAPPGMRTLPTIGLQLYTIRQLMVRDMNAALAAVADAGYTEVEFAGYYERSPEEVRDLVLAHGLDPVSAHIDIEVFRDDMSGMLAAATTVGHRYLILPWLAEEARGSLEAYRALAREMNELGVACKEAGIQFGYHNHAFEFVTVDGGRPFDVLLNETDPELVTFELDLFWITDGGGDVLRYFEEHPGRFSLSHVKGRLNTGQMVDVGDGHIPWGNLFARAKDAGFKHFFVEHDTPEDPLQTIRRSHAYLQALTF